MRGRFSIVFLTYVIALTASAFAAPREKAGMPSVRPLAVAAETKAEMARYGAVFSRGQSPVDSNWSAMGLTYKTPLELYHAITAINGEVGGME